MDGTGSKLVDIIHFYHARNSLLTMNDSNLFGNENRTIDSRPPLGEDLLPPIEKPSARFIIQLFVVPALIVILIVAVWVSLSWLVRSTSLSPDKLIAGIEDGPSVARWQRASELANMLQNKSYADFKLDREGAAHLAQILNRELDRSKSADDSEEQATLRIFLARALGRFSVPDGIHELFKAVDTKGGQYDESVRSAALDAIAERVENLHLLIPPQDIDYSTFEPKLKQLANDDDPAIRHKAAYILGKIGLPPALDQLEGLLGDTDPNTRYNAAIGLAQHGNAKGVDTLAEMLDVDDQSGVQQEEGESNKQIKRRNLIDAAIGAAHALKRQNPAADITPVIRALNRLVSADQKTLAKAHVEPRIIDEAKPLLDELKREP